jgi:SAM-dependent methyltransferase
MRPSQIVHVHVMVVAFACKPSSRMNYSDERRRITGVYSRYRESARRQRAWSAENAGNVAIRAELVNRAFALLGPRLPGAASILDVGCGSGWWLERLAGDEQVSAQLHGLDLLAARAAAARARVPGAAVVVGDARKLPYGASSFDVVTLFTVLSSLPSAADAERAIAEARRVLRPAGALLIWEPRLPNPLNPSTILIGRRLLARALAGARVQTVTTTVLPPLARRLGGRTGQLYPRLARIGPLRTHRLVGAWARAAANPQARVRPAAANPR